MKGKKAAPEPKEAHLASPRHVNRGNSPVLGDIGLSHGSGPPQVFYSGHGGKRALLVQPAGGLKWRDTIGLGPRCTSFCS